MARFGQVQTDNLMLGFLRQPNGEEFAASPGLMKAQVARVQRSGTRDLRGLTGRSRDPRCALLPGYFVPRARTFTVTCPVTRVFA